MVEQLAEVFTDEILSPTRTTRMNWDPSRDGVEGIIRGDLLLVPTTPYRGRETVEWVAFEHDAPGSASVYPYKGRTKDGIPVQVKAAEVVAWARPFWLHEVLTIIRREIA